MMNDMMHNTFVDRHGQEGADPRLAASPARPAPPDDYKDAWFMGFTGNLVAGVWLGNDDGALTKSVTGGNLPTEVWHNFMKVALKDQKPVPLPGSEYFMRPGEIPVADAGGGQQEAAIAPARHKGGGHRRRTSSRSCSGSERVASAYVACR